MSKIEMLKRAVGLVVSIGVGVIIGNGVKCTTPASMGKIIKICVGVGGFALSSMVSDKVVSYTDNQIDEGIVWIKEMINSEEI